jgi:hypothetical protein
MTHTDDFYRYYMALGIPHTSTQEEIQDAYVKAMHHFENDSSLDAEMRRKEIEEAYIALTVELNDNNTYLFLSDQHNTAEENHFALDPNSYKDGKIPLTLGNLSLIFVTSLRELATRPSGPLQLVLYSAMACGGGSRFTGYYTMPFAKMAFYFFGISWILFVFFRYYCLPSHWPTQYKFIAAALYGSIFGFLCAMFYNIPASDLAKGIFFSAISIIGALLIPF